MPKINCFLIGVQKAGTSSFYDWLSQHPEITAPQEMKDLNFFSHEKHFQKGCEWLESFYKRESKILLQGAVNYFYFEESPALIRQYNDQSKFIVILRNPVKRAFSAFQYFSKLGTENRSFSQAIEDELAGRVKPEEMKNFAYLQHGNYYEQLSNWYKSFGKDQILVLIYEELFADPAEHLKKVFRFLNVDSSFSPDFNTKNKTGAVRHKWINKAIFANRTLRAQLKKYLFLDKVIPFGVRVRFLNWLRDWNTKKTAESSKPDSGIYADVEQYYTGANKRLAALLDKNLREIWHE